MKIKGSLYCGIVWMISNLTFAQTWIPSSAPSNDWTSVSSSADGSVLVAAAGVDNDGDGLIYISTNSGLDWTQTSAPTNSWTAVASSADGRKLIAAANAVSNLIFISTNAGLDWSAASAPSDAWQSVASSSDGRTLLAAADSDLIYYSTNSGADWNPGDGPVSSWNSIACSANGVITVAANGSRVWLSRDSGATWTQADLPTQFWESVASSADGTKLFATAFMGAFGGNSTIVLTGISTNAGASWITNNNFGANIIVSSANGNTLTSVIDTGAPGTGTYSSSNMGTTWIQETDLWGIVACSADGGKLVLGTLAYSQGFGGSTAIVPGPIYISQTITSPSINVTSDNGNITLSWLVPSTNFVLQQSDNLESWSALTNQPALNLTNLNNEVTLPTTNGNGYYRLATP